MAIKWFDKESDITAKEARNTIKPGGSWWSTNDAKQYLRNNDLSVSENEDSNSQVVDVDYVDFINKIVSNR